jgi:hypothetical protein
MSKILTVNPDLFKLPGSRRSSRKRTSSDTNPSEIRVRAPREPNKRTLTNKNALLRFIRDQQHRNEQSIGGNTKNANDVLSAAAQEYATDFDDSLQFLMDIANKVNTVPPPQPTPTVQSHPLVHNHTFKTMHQPHYVPDIPTDTNVSMVFPDGGGGNALHLAAPTYGCLKGGVKPTYRQYYQLNQPHSYPSSMDPRSYPSSTGSPHPASHNITQRSYPPVNLDPRSRTTEQRTDPRSHYTTNVGGVVGGGRNDRKVTDLVKLANQSSVPKLIYPKQKRTVRRTFNIGKSKTQPKVSVLVSNRTIRRNITTKTHEIKQTPIHEIKLFLIKRGLIRVGTAAPNNVLRQMYESATMLCGDVYNHNPDTLLYNFFNSDPKI